MMDHLHRLIESLRDELKQYGEMLALLDQQQETVASRSAHDILETVAAINQQSGVIERARGDRLSRQRDLARHLMGRDETSFAELMPLTPPDYRPLLTALVEENNELLLRVQQRARQNHLLLSRSVELMQRFLGTLFPGTRSTVYNGEGVMFSPAIPGRPLYNAVG